MKKRLRKNEKMEHIDIETMSVLLEMLELCEFFLQKYSQDYHLKISKTGFEAQYREWAKKRVLLHELIIWLEASVFELDD